MASQSRKHRGMRSQRVVADWFARRGWPFAESTGAGRSGEDVTGVPGLRIEVKARRGFSPLAWLRQARGGPTHGVPFVVFRCDGQGEASVGEWGVLMRLDDFTDLLHEAGYGDRPPSEVVAKTPVDQRPEGGSEEEQDDDALDVVPGLGLDVTHGTNDRAAG